MKQIIPFKKDIAFNTKIGEITSISLEHTLKLDETDHIAGEFIVSGDYKITDISLNREAFSYNLPFDITLDTKYKKDNLKLDIDDFYYEIVNDQILNINIDVLIDGIEVLNEYKIERESEEMKNDNIIDTNDDLNISEVSNTDDTNRESDEEVNDIEDLERDVKDLFKEIDTPPINVIIEEKEPAKLKTTSIDGEKLKSLFESLDENTETFSTYHVHIVRENDTIETIAAKYKTNKDEIEAYNKIDDLKLGDKIVIPAVKDE